MVTRWMMLAISTSLSVPAMAMEALSEGALASTTGQNGFSLQVAPVSGGTKGLIGLQHLGWTDTDGLTTTQSVANSGKLTLGFAANGGVKFCTTTGNDTCAGALSTRTIGMTVDMDGGPAAAPAPILYAKLSLQSDIQRIHLDLARISLCSGVASRTACDASNAKYTLATVGTNGININLNAAPVIGVDLGNEVHGGMIQLNSFNIQSIKSDVISLRSWNADGTDAGAGVNFSLDIGAMDLSGAFFDISQNGLIFSKSSLTIASAALKDVSMGQVGIGSGVFDGVKNGSMGSFGATNIVISNPRIAVSGM